MARGLSTGLDAVLLRRAPRDDPTSRAREQYRHPAVNGGAALVFCGRSAREGSSFAGRNLPLQASCRPSTRTDTGTVDSLLREIHRRVDHQISRILQALALARCD